MAKAPTSKAASQTDEKKVVKATPRKTRETVATLRKRVDDIVARLEHADTLNKESLTSLEHAFGVLEKRVKQDGQINKAALTRRVDQLSDKLTNLVNDTQTAVAKDLKAVMDNPTIERLQSALNRADIRVTQAEVAQATALTKVNQHIASLAKALDARLTEERTAREHAIARLEETLALSERTHAHRFESLEKSSAEAITKLGARMVSMSQDMQQRTDNNTKAVSAKISQIAVQTQKDFDSYRSKLERRLENLEENQRNLDSYTDRTITTLNTRLDSLEYGLSSVSVPNLELGGTPGSASGAPAPVLTPNGDDAFSATPFVPAPPPDEALAAHATSHTAELTLVEEPVAAASPAPIPLAPIPEPVVHEPTPYVPPVGNEAVALAQQPYTDPLPPQPTVPQQAPLPTMPAQPAATMQPSPYGSTAGTVPQSPYDNSPAMNPAPLELAPSAPQTYNLDDLPYDDPAYGEPKADDGVKRPGLLGRMGRSKADSNNGGPKMPNIDPKAMRVGALVMAVAAAGFFAVKTFNKPKAPQSQAPVASNNQGNNMFVNGPDGSTLPGGNPEVNTAQIGAAGTDIPGTPTGPAITEAIGNYADNQGASANIEPATLEEAVATGDPVAEFQMGMVRLNEGKTDEAIALIRKAATKGQPAAQYRLAKFYETGEGVTRDAEMARQLTERAARSGNRIAMHDLALYYAEGKGDVTEDISTAGKWFEKAAERGVVDSQFNLGVLYESGQGLPKNIQEAFFWYSIASKQGDQFAQERVAVLSPQLSAEDSQRLEARIEKFVPIPVDETANGLFRNVSWTVPDVTPNSAAMNPVKTAQTLLNQLGYNTGTPDGAMGPNTRKAIESFQRDNEMNVTGKVDDALLTALQGAAGV